MNKHLIIAAFALSLAGCHPSVPAMPATGSGAVTATGAVAELQPSIAKLPDGWMRYDTKNYGFEFSYPARTKIVEGDIPDGRAVRIELQKSNPALSKVVEFDSATDTSDGSAKTNPCAAESGPKVKIGGVNFGSEDRSADFGGDATLSSVKQYCAVKDGKVVMIVTKLDYPKSGVKTDVERESEIFAQILRTFTFVN